MLKHGAAVVLPGRAPAVESVEVAAVRGAAQGTARPMGNVLVTGNNNSLPKKRATHALRGVPRPDQIRA